MSAVDEALAREYFEMLGFLVRQHRKYVVQAREKTAEEEIDLIVCNPDPEPGCLPGRFEMTSEDLRSVGRAIVVVKGWHTEIFTPAVLKNPDIFRFVEKQTLKEAEKVLGNGGPLLKLLIVPALPTNPSLRQQSIELLRSKGVDGVLSFRAMLQELIARVEINKNYQKSDLLQVLRLLKNYDLIREPQMELFHSRRRPPRRPRDAGAAGEGTTHAAGVVADKKS